jgi:hypothetical protein
MWVHCPRWRTQTWLLSAEFELCFLHVFVNKHSSITCGKNDVSNHRNGPGSVIRVHLNNIPLRNRTGSIAREFGHDFMYNFVGVTSPPSLFTIAAISFRDSNKGRITLKVPLMKTHTLHHHHQLKFGHLIRLILTWSMSPKMCKTAC